MRQKLQTGDAPSPGTNQIDQLGARLRADDYSEDDLHMLDRFRCSYAAAYERTVSAIRDKPHRSSMRLSQIQDIAGYRLIVEDRRQQDELVAQLAELFPGSAVVDRRTKSSYGYRAIHVIVRIGEIPVEVQVRTEPQHAWAEYAEKLADTIDPALKYGGGSQDQRAILNALSNVAHFVEQIELDGNGQHHQFAAALAEVASRLAGGSEPGVENAVPD